jgi:inosine-uridine nucleoside N-ribohydrolase
MNPDRPKILLDCDPGHDDAMAIALAAAHSDLLGITTVSGNVSLADTTRNALTVCEVFNIDVEVHAGADGPLVGSPPPNAAEIHGQTGLDGPTHPETTRTATSANGVEFMIETIRANPGCWLVPVGPLTNVALALRAAPEIVDDLAGISFMGGSVGPGNVTPAAEFNVWADPEAADETLRCGHPDIRMAGLVLTEQFSADDPLLERLRTINTAAATWTAELLEFYLAAVHKVEGQRRGAIHDPCAVLAVTHPDLLTHDTRPVRVETAGEHTRGMTVVDQRGRPNRSAEPADGLVQVARTIDAAAATQLLLDVVAPT